ncbi:uncharacterized protein PpBr36_10627 [Pyricularia pennisetigena]|uniref:uncharacterized protein n=1 Tax=Pyricularia pennisetigena TaxID=1578925 RepID=UPI00115077B9|nr:uncharacterized protein PpBr36_10627 [Pyricularia pennisetigena]TLS21085.1 hypothetical protein PpBr36_10627 [Pyricularia pennisetigena]
MKAIHDSSHAWNDFTKKGTTEQMLVQVAFKAPNILSVQHLDDQEHIKRAHARFAPFMELFQHVAMIPIVGSASMPDLYRRLQVSLRVCFPSQDDMTCLAVLQQPLLNVCINETLRLVPPINGHGSHRMAAYDTVVESRLSIVKQNDKDLYSAEQITKQIAGQWLESGVHLLFDIHDRTFQFLPDTLAEHNYNDINDIHNGVFQKAFGTELSCYEYLAQNPKLQGFMQYAMKLTPNEGDWLDVFPPVDPVKFTDPGRYLFVDVGGGMGHQAIRWRERFSKVPGRVALQDMEITIKRLTDPLPGGVEPTVHNFTDPQPIKGAKFYYLRNVLHGLPDAECVKMLKTLALAFAPDSRLVIDDILVPDQNAGRILCQLDFIMLASIAGKKRTRPEWFELLRDAGYHIEEILTYNAPLQESLIIAYPVSSNGSSTAR